MLVLHTLQLSSWNVECCVLFGHEAQKKATSESGQQLRIWIYSKLHLSSVQCANCWRYTIRYCYCCDIFSIQFPYLVLTNGHEVFITMKLWLVNYPFYASNLIPLQFLGFSYQRAILPSFSWDWLSSFTAICRKTLQYFLQLCYGILTPCRAGILIFGPVNNQTPRKAIFVSSIFFPSTVSLIMII